MEDSATVAETLLDGIVDAFDFERAVLFGAPDDDELVLLTHHGNVNSAAGRVQPGPESVVGTALETRRRAARHLDRPGRRPVAGRPPAGARQLVVVPLIAEGHAIGVLVAEHSLRAARASSTAWSAMVERFASHGALALRNAWLLEQVRAMASTDGLTGIANRLTFNETLERELSRAPAAARTSSLVLMDIDHFKELNDTYGHQTGDDVLRRVAATLRRVRADLRHPPATAARSSA